MESAKKLRSERTNWSFTRTARHNPGQVPMSGPEISALFKIHDSHIERCMLARFESYEKAFAEVQTKPSDDDLRTIIDDCLATRIRCIGHSARSIDDTIGSGAVTGSGPQTTKEKLTYQSGHGQDDVLRRWKIWRARTNLKPPPPAPTPIDNKQLDVMLPVLSRAEFDKDVSKLESGSIFGFLFIDLDKFKSINDGPGGTLREIESSKHLQIYWCRWPTTEVGPIDTVVMSSACCFRITR